MSRILAPSLAIAMLALGVSPANAQDIDAAASTEIVLSDINLSSEAGRAVLERRIDAAARKVCLDGIESRNIVNRAVYKQCRSKLAAQVDAALARQGFQIASAR